MKLQQIPQSVPSLKKKGSPTLSGIEHTWTKAPCPISLHVWFTKKALRTFSEYFFPSSSRFSTFYPSLCSDLRLLSLSLFYSIGILNVLHLLFLFFFFLFYDSKLTRPLITSNNSRPLFSLLLFGCVGARVTSSPNTSHRLLLYSFFLSVCAVVQCLFCFLVQTGKKKHMPKRRWTRKPAEQNNRWNGGWKRRKKKEAGR